MKRIIAMLLCLAMLLSFTPSVLFSASAESTIPEDTDIEIPVTPDDEVEETEPEVPETEEPTTAPEVVERKAVCAACGNEVVWTEAVSGVRITSANGTHFYLPEDFTIVANVPAITVEAGKTLCVDLNGNDFTTATEINVQGVLNIQGEGNVGGNIGEGAFGNGGDDDVDFDELVNAGQGAAYDAALFNIGNDAVVNIYGGTYSVGNDKPVVTASGTLNVLGGEIAAAVNAGNMTLGGAAKVTLIEAANLTVKADWTGTAVIADAILENGVAEGDFTGSLTTTEGKAVFNLDGKLATELPVVLTGITVTAPTKVEYELGEELVLDGMVVTGLYSDETTGAIAEGFTVTGFDSATAGVKTITVTYGEFTATFEVTVKEAAAEITGIEVTTPPTKVSYSVGEAFSTKGMVISAVYSDGSKAAITDYAVNGFDSATTGTKTITVTYGEFSATFTVDVILKISTKLTVANEETGVALSWGAADVDGYVVYRREYVSGTAGEWVMIAETVEPTYLDTAVVNGTKYGYAVSGKVGDAESAKCTEATVTYMEIVKGIELRNVASGVQISWKANKMAGKYWIYRSEFVDGAWSAWDKGKSHADLEKTVYVDRTAVDGVKYRYTVRAQIGSTQYSAYTDGVEVIRLANVTGVSISNQNEGLKLTWKAHANADKIAIYRSAYNADGSSNPWGPIYIYLDGNATEWIDTEAVNGVKYRYSVVAYTDGNTSAQKEHAKVYRLERVNFESVTQVNNGITLTWSKNDAASKYFIYRYRRVDGAWSEQSRKTMLSTDPTSWTDTTVVIGETYRYVIVVNKDGLSSKTSEEVRVTKIGNTTLSLSAQTGRTKVTIKENALATSYGIQRRVTGGEWETIVENTTELIYWDYDVVAGTTYEYRAVATNGTDTCYGRAYSATAK